MQLTACPALICKPFFMFIRHYTKNFGDTAARIKKQAAKLDKDWFQSKKKEFVKLCINGEDYYEAGTPPDVQQVDFDLYCFSANYSKGVTGSSIADKIIETTNAIIDDAGDDKDYPAIKFWIDNVKAWVQEAINENADYYKSEEYTHVMHGVLRKIQWEVDYYFNDKLKALELKFHRNNATTVFKKVKIVRSYKWQGKPEELSKLYNKMKGDFIALENRLQDFKHVFSNKDLSMINAIRWHDDNASELLYFIMQLEKYGLLKAGKRLNYAALTGCFVTNEGKKFTASFKNLKQSIPVKLSGVKMAKIEALVKSFA